MPPLVSTYSVVALDPLTRDLGVAVQSRFLAVGAVVPWAKAGVGAIATQAYANTSFAPKALERLSAGQSPEDVIGSLIDEDSGSEFRQLGIVDATGRSAVHTGAKTEAWAGHRLGPGYAIQGNLLAGPEVVTAMEEDWLRASDALFPERLVAVLDAGEAVGGDRRGRQSAAVLVVRQGGGYGGFSDRYIDLRVDDHPEPIDELKRLLTLHRAVFPDG